MANPEVERLVDDLIKQGRVTQEMKSEYVSLIERGLGDHLLRGADYTNKTKELADQRRQAEQWLAQERQKIQAEADRLKQWETSAKGELERSSQVMNQLPELTARVAAYEQKLKDYQIFDEVVVPPIKAPTPAITDPYKPPQQTQPGVTVGKFITVDDANQFGNNLLQLVKKVSKIESEHRRLFGTDLDDDLIEHFQTTGEDPEQHWRVKYAVENKKREIESTRQEAERAKVREEERAKLMSEMALDPNRVVGGMGQQHKGGLSPLLEAYTGSRALAHSENPVGDKKTNDFIPPEKRSEIPAGRERIAAASKMFAEHFDVAGNPTTDEGRRLSQRYSSGQ